MAQTINQLVEEEIRSSAPRLAELTEGLTPEQTRWVRRTVDEFVEHDLRPRSAITNQRAARRYVLKLLLLALEREEVVSVSYRWRALGLRPSGGSELSAIEGTMVRALLRIWDDETFHAAFFDEWLALLSPRRARVHRFRGRMGGWMVSTLQAHPGSANLRRLAAWGARRTVKGLRMITRSVDEGLRSLRPEPYCVYNVGLEATAELAYLVLAQILMTPPWEQTAILEDRTAPFDMFFRSMFPMDIAAQEHLHGVFFNRLARRFAQTLPDEEFVRFVQGVRLRVPRLGPWPSHSRLTPTLGEPGGAFDVTGASVSSSVDSLLERLSAALGAWCERTLGAGSRKFVWFCVSDPDLHPGVEPVSAPLTTAVVGWLGRLAITTRVPFRISLIAPRDEVQRVRWADLWAGDLTALTDHPSGPDQRQPAVPSLASATWQPARDKPLPSYGGFVASDPDLMTFAPEPWVYADVRISLSTLGRKGQVLPIDALTRIPATRYDVPDEEGWHDVPEMAVLAALRMIGVFPPDLCVALVGRGRKERRVAGGMDCLEFNARVAGMSGTDPVRSEAYFVGSLAQQA